MAVRKLKPTSAGRRFQTVSDFAEITRSTPEKSLTEGLTKKSGYCNRSPGKHFLKCFAVSGKGLI